ncbi:general substrate transporter [Podospora australis]|uniref:General substrate transporter n=1 Tax=Podospora australis TaxID=1536484 RepID=A0AAN6WP94_9PEZI|nr:general substrate transporter [Podospora australis]
MWCRSLDTGSIGPVTTTPSFISALNSGDPLSPTLHGAIVSSILLTGALFASVAGILADRYGRNPLIVFGCCVYGLGATIECGSPQLWVFILGRLIRGAGAGLFLSAVWVQVGEMSPTSKRGVMTALSQFTLATGLMTGYFVCYGANSRFKGGEAAWRIPLGFGAALAFVLGGVAAMVPPSPRWLMLKGRVDEARAVVGRLGLAVDEQEDLLNVSALEMHGSPGSEEAKNGFWAAVAQMFKEFGEAFEKPFRSRTLFGCFIMGFQQFSGIDGVLYYAPILFRQAGLQGDQATFLASGMSALVILVVSIPACLFADKWGRKTSSLVGGVLITGLMALMGSLYAAGEVRAESGAGRWVVIVCIFLFAMVFSVTWAIGFRTFLVESLPRKTRSSASALAQSSNWIANYIVALSTPALIAKSTFGAYYFFAGCSFICTVMVALYMSETRGHSLEAIEARYQEGASRITGRQLVQGLPLRRLRLRTARE